tara:strand:- start:636 stop:764 length:129 start_codon:yes stop_codon:yes gene_type:complete
MEARNKTKRRKASYVRPEDITDEIGQRHGNGIAIREKLKVIS